MLCGAILSRMASDVRVRPVTATDVPRLLDLIDELADYECLPRPDAGARRRLAADATADPPRFAALLGELDGEAVGYAIWFLTYSTFLARPSLYLEDIFVRPAARRHGVGLALFRACAKEAVRRGCGRYEWQVLSWNTLAIDFYERHGARHQAGWLPFRLDGEPLAALGA
jgi:GNAT superfamily N-acetyltransferase